MIVSLRALPGLAESNIQRPTTILGPWLGEFGIELIYWQGFVRKYCLDHPDEYIICLGPPGHKGLYEQVQEYWEISIDLPREPNFYLSGLERQTYNLLVYKLIRERFLFGKLALPEYVFQMGWLEFGDPFYNQRFIPLKSSLLTSEWIAGQTRKPLVLLFPRVRESDSSKNWPKNKWKQLGHLLEKSGLEILVCGGGKECDPFSGSLPTLSDFDLENEYLDLTLAMISQSSCLVSGESGSGFFPGLCGKTGVIFGSPREKLRYEKVENIFQAPILYIEERNPTVEVVYRGIQGVFK